LRLVCAPLAVALTYAQSAPVEVIDELVAVHPASYPTVQAMTPDGHWIFSAEGGSLAFVFVGADNPSSVSFPGNPPRRTMGAAEKRLQVGSLGVLAADLELDPGLDLTDEPKTLPPGTDPEKYWPTDEDYEDILYIAGGHLGLWAMEAHPIAEYDNNAVRVDNSGDLNVSTQDSNRFCTDVEVVRIGGQDYLLALFARRDDNLLRIYRLQDVRSALDAVRNGPAGVSDLGHEILGEASFYSVAHSLQGPEVLDPVTGDSVTRSGSYAMDMAVDTNPDVSDLVGNSAYGDPVDVYIAMLSGGLVRYRLYSTGTPAMIFGFKTEGPIFGTGVTTSAPASAYDAVTQFLGNVPCNASGLPAQWFKNHESRVAARSSRFTDIIRSDPPYFMDVALQNDDGGHYLFCAMGHLGWIRFQLGSSHHFKYGMLINHLEGRPAIKRDANGVPADPVTDPVRVAPLSWGRIFPLDVPSSSPFLEAFDLGDPDRPNAMHALQLALTRVGTGANLRTVLVVNYGQLPWTMEPRIKGPGRILDQTFGEIGAFDLEYLPLARSETAAVLVVYDDLDTLTLPFRYASGQVISKDTSGIDLANHTRATRFGGESLYVHHTQPDNGLPSRERVRILHTDKVLVEVNDAGLLKPDRGNVCVSFIDFATGTNSPLAAYPAIVRDQTQMLGRYGFGAAFADIDDRVVFQANNDFPVDPAAPVVSLGLETGFGELGQLAPPLPPPPPIVWNDLRDRRLDSGIQSDERCQFLRDIGGGNFEQWIIGDRTIPLDRGTYYYFGQHSYQSSMSGVPTIDLVGQWLLGRAQSRYGIDHHGYYRSMTSDPQFDTFTLGASASVGTHSDGFDPLNSLATTFVTASRIGSPDGVIVLGRNTTLSYLMGFPAMDNFVYQFRNDPWKREVDITYLQMAPTRRSPDWAFTLNSHPEWNNLHYPRRSVAPTLSTLARSQQLFYHDPIPTLATTEPIFIGRRPSNTIFPIKEVVSTYTFLPKVTELQRESTGPEKALVLGAPCGYASCPPDLSTLLGTKLAVDPNNPFPPVNPNGTVGWTDDFHFLPIPPEYNATTPWNTQFRRGFVSLWQISNSPAFPTSDPQGPPGNVLGVDPWSRARRATDPTPAVNPTLPERPAGSPDLDPLFLVGDGSMAFQLHFLKLTNDSSVECTFALVADFSGTVQAFDITDLLLVSIGPRFPALNHIWTAPLDPLELRRPNIFDVATDRTSDPGRANVYVACTRMGVQVVAFDADQGFVGPTQHIVTPGSVHSVTVQVNPQGRLLLVNDLMAGQRFYRKP